MTEQEAKVLVAQLTQIWVPETDWVTQKDWLPQWGIRNRSFTYSTKVAPNIRLTYTTGYSAGTDIIFLFRQSGWQTHGLPDVFYPKSNR